MYYMKGKTYDLVKGGMVKSMGGLLLEESMFISLRYLWMISLSGNSQGLLV